MTVRIGYLGPPGTNTEAALRTQEDFADAEMTPMSTIADVVEGVASRKVDLGLVPIENQVEGSVNITLDVLAQRPDLLIRREIVSVVDNNLIGLSGTDLGEVREILSHPHATAQCRHTVEGLLPQAVFVATNSTAEAVQEVAGSERRDRVAIGPRIAAGLYGATVLRDDVSDHPGAETRFVLLGHGVPPRTGADKTSIVCHLGVDRPGSLLAILQEFAARGLNLTKIESRPTKGGLGEYWFFIDIEGHLADALVQDALRGLRFRFGSVHFLGSYPRARRRGIFHEEEEEAAWAQAGEWVTGLVAEMEGD
ncbi:MAG: prephenate dehydratase [Acidimicrobiia bacterium]|nr:prephenate dehydratase [Acidimicrobiia bacterium]